MGGIFDSIPPEFVTGGGFATLAFLAVFFILTGRLVPRSTHEETRADRDAWRRVAETEAETRRVQSAQLDELLQTARTTERLMTAIQERLADRPPPRGGGR